jgi:hypothetical protein
MEAYHRRRDLAADEAPRALARAIHGSTFLIDPAASTTTNGARVHAKERSMRTWSNRTAAAALGCLVCLVPRLSSAKCPERDPGAVECEPIVSFLMPSVAGAVFFPRDAGGRYYGGGVEFALLSWASNNDAFGPSHGRLRATFTYLAGAQNRRVALYRFGGIVSFEGNASRRFLIPYFGGAIGGVWETRFGSHAAFDASLGLYLVHTRRFVLDAEGGWVLPFTDVDTLMGPRVQLTASFALW